VFYLDISPHNRLRIVCDSPNSSPREKVEVDIEHAFVVAAEGDNGDRSTPLSNGGLPKGFLSWRRISMETTREKPSTKNAVAGALVTPPPLPKVKDKKMVSRSHIKFENASLPPLWTNDAPDSQLAFTYQYPRFFLQDPTQVIDHNLWSFHLGR
jgi:hypothetical protein